MEPPEFLHELESCGLCEHRCGVNRLAGETGVCRVTMPSVASAALHPAPPESYTVFLSGCNYKCLNCQNWTISQYPGGGSDQRGYVNPKNLAEECIRHLHSPYGKMMGADRIFFSGGEATIHLPFIEKVVEEARKLEPETKINFDTNGYLTEQSLERVLRFTTSVTYDIKAYSHEVHLALTGARSEPVLRNAEFIGRYAKDKLWEYRILVIPDINENEIRPLMQFIARIDTSLSVCFLAFRPNFVLENHPGASGRLMERCVAVARDAGLKNAFWAGHTGLAGQKIPAEQKIKNSYSSHGAWIAGSYAFRAGCKTHPRVCALCEFNQNCQVKRYSANRMT